MTHGNLHIERWSGVLDTFEGAPLRVADYLRSGRIVRATGMVLEAVGLRLPLGAPVSLSWPRKVRPACNRFMPRRKWSVLPVKSCT